MCWLNILCMISLVLISKCRKFSLDISEYTLQRSRWELIGKYCINQNQQMIAEVNLKYQKTYQHHQETKQRINLSGTNDMSVHFRVYEDKQYETKNNNDQICQQQEISWNEFDRKVELQEATNQMEFGFRLIADNGQCYIMILVFCNQDQQLMSDNRVIVDMDVQTNDDRPNMSIHERGYQLFRPLVVMGVVLVVVNSVALYRSGQSQDEFECFNYLLLFLTIIQVVEVVNQVFYQLYFGYLEYSGKIYGLYLLVYMLESVSTYNLILMMLMVVLWGYSILEDTIEDMDILVLIGFSFMLFTTIINVIERLINIYNYQYDSDFSTVGNLTICIFNLLILIYFFYQYDEIYLNYKVMNKTHYHKFFTKVFIAGVVWILAPLLIKPFFYLFVYNYNRQFYERLFINLSNWTYLLIMQYQFYSQQSTYYMISKIGVSGQLPIDKDI